MKRNLGEAARQKLAEKTAPPSQGVAPNQGEGATAPPKQAPGDPPAPAGDPSPPSTPQAPTELEVDLGQGPQVLPVEELQRLARLGSSAATAQSEAEALKEQASNALGIINRAQDPNAWRGLVREMEMLHGQSYAAQSQQPAGDGEGDGWSGEQQQQPAAPSAPTPEVAALTGQVQALQAQLNQQQQASADAALEARLERAIGDLPGMAGKSQASRVVRSLANGYLRSRENPRGFTDDVNLAVQTAYRDFSNAQQDPTGDTLSTVSPRNGGAGTGLDTQERESFQNMGAAKAFQTPGGVSSLLTDALNRRLSGQS